MKTNSAIAVIRRFVEVDSQQAALALESLPSSEAAALLRAMPITAAVLALERVQPSFAAEMLQQLLPEPAQSLLQRVPSEHAADIFRSLTPDGRQAVLDGLPPERKAAMQELLSYPEESAGRVMRTDFLAFHKEMRVKDVITRLRALAQKQATTTYCYVVGPENKLVGVLNMRDLLLALPDAALESVMRADVVSVPAFTDREELVHLATEKRFLSMPVVDAQGRLVGAVRSEDLLQSSQEEATEDVQLMFGASPDERVWSPLGFKISRRLPWLHVNLLTAFLAGAVVALFEDLIARLSVLAVFLPIIAGQGGNAGTQSLAVIIRGLVMREIRPADAWSVVSREFAIGAINGLAIGAVTGVAAWLWMGSPFLGLVVALAMLVNLVAAGIAGAAIPLLMKRFGFDPAQSSGIFLTTVTDIVGFSAFLSFALLFESRLVP